jgi:UDP-glucose 4-epimerase
MELMKIRVEPIYKKQREGDIEHSYADTSKATEILRFKSETPLRVGLKQTTEMIPYEVSNK